MEFSVYGSWNETKIRKDFSVGGCAEISKIRWAAFA